MKSVGLSLMIPVPGFSVFSNLHHWWQVCSRTLYLPWNLFSFHSFHQFPYLKVLVFCFFNIQHYHHHRICWPIAMFPTRTRARNIKSKSITHPSLTCVWGRRVVDVTRGPKLTGMSRSLANMLLVLWTYLTNMITRLACTPWQRISFKYHFLETRVSSLVIQICVRSLRVRCG